MDVPLCNLILQTIGYQPWNARNPEIRVHASPNAVK